MEYWSIHLSLSLSFYLLHILPFTFTLNSRPIGIFSFQNYWYIPLTLDTLSLPYLRFLLFWSRIYSSPLFWSKKRMRERKKIKNWLVNSFCFNYGFVFRLCRRLRTSSPSELNFISSTLLPHQNKLKPQFHFSGGVAGGGGAEAMANFIKLWKKQLISSF